MFRIGYSLPFSRPKFMPKVGREIFSGPGRKIKDYSVYIMTEGRKILRLLFDKYRCLNDLELRPDA